MLVNNLDPIIWQANFISLRWYGLFLALGVILFILLVSKIFKQKQYPLDLALDLCIYLVIGGLIGARLGEILFYQPAFYFSNPQEIIFINHGGLSSHGLAIGLLIALLLFSKIKKIPFQQYLDILVIPLPLLAAFIRLGNFFNSEIVGRPTDLPWGVYFPNYEVNLVLRHPTQLYEALASLTLYFILYTLYKKYSQKLPLLFTFNFFLLTYFGSRFLLEFTKEYQTSWEGTLTAGQWLSLPFIVWGLVWLVNLKNRKKIK